MFTQLLAACHYFYTKTASLRPEDLEHLLLEDARNRGEEADPEYAKRLAKDIAAESKKLKAPKSSDKQDMVILLNRSAQAISQNDVHKFVTSLSALKELSQKFAPEKLDSELADFILDTDVWEWLEQLKHKMQPNKHDLLFLEILKNNLLFLAARMK